MRTCHLAFLSAIALMICFSASAQDNRERKPLESNFQIGAGLFSETGNQANDVFPGAVLRLSYGLDVRVSDNWSIMPGAGIRTQLGEINHIGWVGGDPDGMSFADVFCSARYHLRAGKGNMVIGLGPEISIMTDPDTYYIDADPNDPLDGKEKFKRVDFGLQPSVVFQTGRHWQWGFEANIGLKNMMRQYPEYNRTGDIHLHNLMFTCGWRF